MANPPQYTNIPPVGAGPVTVEWLNMIANAANLMNRFTIAFGTKAIKTGASGNITINVGDASGGATMINGPFLTQPIILVTNGDGRDKIGGEENGGIYFTVIPTKNINIFNARALKVKDGKPVDQQIVRVNWFAIGKKW